MKHILWILLIGVLISCDNTKMKKPNDLISENSMVDIIVELSLLNSAQGLKKSVLDDEGIIPESYVYKKYNIDSVQFAQSNAYYAHNIDAYQELYKKVKTKLEAEKAKYKKINDAETKEKKIQDSIQRAKRRAYKLSKTKDKRDVRSKRLLEINDSLPE